MTQGRVLLFFRRLGQLERESATESDQVGHPQHLKTGAPKAKPLTSKAETTSREQHPDSLSTQSDAIIRIPKRKLLVGVAGHCSSPIYVGALEAAAANQYATGPLSFLKPSENEAIEMDKLPKDSLIDQEAGPGGVSQCDGSEIDSSGHCWVIQRHSSPL